MVRITNTSFIIAFTAAAIAMTGSVIAVSEIWAGVKGHLTNFGVAIALIASWINILTLAVVAGRAISNPAEE